MEITPEEKIKLEKLAAKYELELLVLFGSAVTGKTHKESDADVAYLSKKPLTLREESEMSVALQPILKNRTIDLVNIRMAPPLLLYAITDHGKVLYQSDPLVFYELRAYAFKRYIEAEPLSELKKQRLKALLNI